MWSPVKITGAFRMSSGLYLFTPNCRARTQRKERGMLACWVSIMPAADLPVSPPTLQFTRWLEFTGTSGMCFTTRTQGRLAFVADSWIFRGRSVFFCVCFFFSDICFLIPTELPSSCIPGRQQWMHRKDLTSKTVYHYRRCMPAVCWEV